MFYFLSHVVSRFFEFFRIVFIFCNFLVHFGSSMEMDWKIDFLCNLHLHYVSDPVYVMLQCVSV